MKKQQPPALIRTLKENGKRRVSTVTVNRNNDSINNFFSKRTVETPRKKVVETDISNGDAKNPANKSTFTKETKNKSILRTNISGPEKDSTYIEKTIKPTERREGKTIVKVQGYNKDGYFNTKKKTTIPKLKK